MTKPLSGILPLFFSIFLAAAAAQADCGQPHGPSEPSGETPSAPPPTPESSGGGESGSVSDQLGRTLEPETRGTNPGPMVFGGGGSDDWAKKFSKNSPELGELKKLEKQAASDKKTLDRAQEEARDALKDLGEARRDVDRAVGRLSDHLSGDRDANENQINDFKDALRRDWNTERNAQEKEDAFSHALRDEASSRKDIYRARDEAGKALRDFDRARQDARWKRSDLENAQGLPGVSSSEVRDMVGKLEDSVRNELQAEHHSQEKMDAFNKSIDRASESREHFEARLSELGVQNK